MVQESEVRSFTDFALHVYGADGVSAACLQLQSRFGLDVNLLLFASFVGASRCQVLTERNLERANRSVDPWHQEVVRALRAVHERLKSGLPPSPITGRRSFVERFTKLRSPPRSLSWSNSGSWP